MILMLSGEGKTDMGQLIPTVSGMRFVAGPMAWLVDRLVERWTDFSPIGVCEMGGDTVRFIPEAELNELGKKDPAILPGIKRGKGTAYFVRNANTLGVMAKKMQIETDTPVVAVLFRDTDKTHSASKTLWQEKHDSMKLGFQRAGFLNGVAMVPLPKSEAWMLCALKSNAYQQCEKLEEAPGNDNSPNSLKKWLEMQVGHDPTAEEQTEWVRSGKVDPDRIDMPSFNAFRNDLEAVLESLR